MCSRAARFGSGNPLALVLDAQGLDSDAMQTIARSSSHPETVFVLPPENPAQGIFKNVTPACDQCPSPDIRRSALRSG